MVQNVNNFENIQVYNADHRLIAAYDRPEQISGYEYEVEACIEAIEEERTECPQMPHAEIIQIMEFMNEIRGQIGVVYPGE